MISELYLGCMNPWMNECRYVRMCILEHCGNQSKRNFCEHGRCWRRRRNEVWSEKGSEVLSGVAKILISTSTRYQHAHTWTFMSHSSNNKSLYLSSGLQHWLFHHQHPLVDVLIHKYNQTSNSPRQSLSAIFSLTNSTKPNTLITNISRRLFFWLPHLSVNEWREGKWSAGRWRQRLMCPQDNRKSRELEEESLRWRWR